MFKMKAVIFDMDGVIYNSTPYIWKAREIYLKKYGVKLNEKEISILLGNSFRDLVEILNKKYNLSLDFNDFSEKTRELQVELMKKDLKPSKGCKDLVEDLLKNKIKIAIASNNLRKFIVEDLKILGLLKYFMVIVSVEEVEKHKPNPDIFIKTAGKLNILPKDCIVIEDAVDGVKAAKSAGMKAVAVLTKFHKKEDFENADLIINSLEEINYNKINEL